MPLSSLFLKHDVFVYTIFHFNVAHRSVNISLHIFALLSLLYFKLHAHCNGPDRKYTIVLTMVLDC
jgi:hypothetical protein